MLQAAIEAEATAVVDQSSSLVDANRRRVVVRNGYLPEREIVTGVGSVS